MSESKFDPRKFAAFKFRSAVELKKVLKADKSGKKQQQPPVQAVKTAEKPQEQKQEKTQEQPAEKPKEERTGPGRTRIASELLLTALIAFVIALFIRAFIVQIVYVPTSGMEPMLRAGDRVVVFPIVTGG